MSSPVLILDNVGKRYTLPAPDSGPSNFWQRLRPRGVDFWALRGLNLQVGAGEALGIIGHNGAGKSTLLKVLTGITAPSEGELGIQGRVAGLLEVGSGFHPELTGRENIFLSGTILGMKRAEIHQRLQQIIDFAEVRPFIDLPVKRFSSGMFVRLGFSIAAHLEPDLLLLDEVLAVGDSSFQQKCLQHVRKMRESGVTIVFISHDLKAVEQLCTRTILLQNGKMIHDGPTPETIAAYQKVRGANGGVRRVSHAKMRLEIQRVRCVDCDGNDVDHGQTGASVAVRLEFVANEALRGVTFTVAFWTSGFQIRTKMTTPAGKEIDVDAGCGAVEFHCDPLLLRPDLYQIEVRAYCAGDDEALDWLAQAQALPVQSTVPVEGDFEQPFRFTTADA